MPPSWGSLFSDQNVKMEVDEKCEAFTSSGIPPLVSPPSSNKRAPITYFQAGCCISKKFSQWSFTSKKFHQKIPTGSKVIAVSKQGTSGAIYFLSTWFQRVFMRLLLLFPEKGDGN